MSISILDDKVQLFLQSLWCQEVTFAVIHVKFVVETLAHHNHMLQYAKSRLASIHRACSNTLVDPGKKIALAISHNGGLIEKANLTIQTLYET